MIFLDLEVIKFFQYLGRCKKLIKSNRTILKERINRVFDIIFANVHKINSKFYK
jgi:hypothetical protein